MISQDELAKLVRFNLLDSTTYSTLKSTNQVIESNLYFLSDTHEIYKGIQSYTKFCETYTGNKPSAPAENRLYVNLDNYEASIWDGQKWTVVNPAISQTITEIQDGKAVPTKKPVSGAAVKTYVDKMTNDTIAQCITNIIYKPETHSIEITKGSTASDLQLTKLGTDITYDSKTGVMKLIDAAGNTLSTINIPLDNFVTSGTYNDTDKAIELTLKDGSVIKIPASDLVKLYQGAQTNSTITTIDTTNGNNLIKVDVRVSSQLNNAIVVNSDGLYVPVTDGMSKVATGHEGEVIIAKADGDPEVSGYKIGGPTLAQTGGDHLLATEAAVKNLYDTTVTMLDATYVKKTDIIQHYKDINITNPSDSKIISEKVLVEALSWHTPVTSVSVPVQTLSGVAGTNTEVAVSVLPEAALQEVTAKSSAEANATVEYDTQTKKWKINFLKEGTADITFTSVSNPSMTAVIHVSVTAAPAPTTKTTTETTHQ